MIKSIKSAARRYPSANMAGLGLRHMFKEADDDGNGFLDYQEILDLRRRKFGSDKEKGLLGFDEDNERSVFYDMIPFLKNQNQITFEEFAALFRGVGPSMAKEMLPNLESFIRPLLFPSKGLLAVRLTCVYLEFGRGDVRCMGRCDDVHAHTVPQLASNVLTILAHRVYLSDAARDPEQVRKSFRNSMLRSNTTSRMDVVFDTAHQLRWVQFSCDDLGAPLRVMSDDQLGDLVDRELTEKMREFPASCKLTTDGFAEVSTLAELDGECEIQLSRTAELDCLKFIGVKKQARFMVGQFERIAENVCATFAVCAAQAAVAAQDSREANANKTKLASAVAALLSSTVLHGQLTATHRVQIVADVGGLLASAAAQPASKGTVTRLEAGANILIDMLQWNPNARSGVAADDIKQGYREKIVVRESGSLETLSLSDRLATTFAEIDVNKDGSISNVEGWDWLQKFIPTNAFSSYKDSDGNPDLVKAQEAEDGFKMIWEDIAKKRGDENNASGETEWHIGENNWQQALQDLIADLKNPQKLPDEERLLATQIGQTIETNVGCGTVKGKSYRYFAEDGRLVKEDAEWDSALADQVLLPAERGK